MVFGPQGSRIRCQHVLITAPITCLGRNDIEFVPPLPLRKQVLSCIVCALMPPGRCVSTCACDSQHASRISHAWSDALQMAMKRIHMHNAVKVLLAFNHPFWPTGFFDAVCLGGLSPAATLLPARHQCVHECCLTDTATALPCTKNEPMH